MAMMNLPMVGQSYHLDDWHIDCQRTLNFYPQAVESGNGRYVSALLPTDGLTLLHTLDGGAVRGLYAVADRLLAVCGETLYKIIGQDVATIGTVAGTGLVQFADNGLSVMMVGDGGAYAYTLADDTLTALVINDDTGFFGASSVAFLDSRFVWSVPNSGQVQWSELLSTDTTALNYATAEAKSDRLVRLVAVGGQLWLIGEKTTEIWNSTGSKDSPYVRQSGAYIPMGCVAKDTVAVMGGGLIWLGQSELGSYQVVMSQGYQTIRISNHAIESVMASYDVAGAYAYAYQASGHGFYVLSFPANNKTFVFDVATQMWHERSFYNWQTATHETHLAKCHAFYQGVHFVGDRGNGNIYKLDDKNTTDNGSIVVRERSLPCINAGGGRLIFDEVQIFAQVGQMTDTKPLLLFDWSDDGGVTWSNDRVGHIGAVGQFKHRIIFRRLGQSYARVFRVRTTDTGRYVLLGAKAVVR